MTIRTTIATTLLLCTGILSCTAQQQDEKKNPYYKQGEKARIAVSDAQWKKVLTPKVYNILREKGTEPANSGPYVHNDKKGTYYCAACGNALFVSGTKFDSHTGWPSFYQAYSDKSIATAKDDSYGMERDEVMCARRASGSCV
jgi:peptide-methionine (R)-S-oxide reductase